MTKISCGALNSKITIGTKPALATGGIQRTGGLLCQVKGHSNQFIHAVGRWL
jgi:hypothetical protein